MIVLYYILCGIGIYVLLSVLAVYMLWIYYLAVMNLKSVQNRGELVGVAKYLGYTVFYCGLTLDILVNIFVMTTVFLEIPKETVVTSRFKRHIYLSTGRRESIAAWFCSRLLNPFDPSGSHCGGRK